MARVRMLWTCAWLALVPGTGCDSGETGPTFDGALCGPTTCPGGCCHEGICVAPPTASQCGVGGASCSPCLPGQTCINGACFSSTDCGPASCPAGCCLNGQCLGGLTNNACGTGGAACVDCTMTGQTCDLATMTCQGSASCGPATCPSGCCKNGQCQGGNANDACGSGGTACTDCTLAGASCDATTKTCTGGAGCTAASCASGCCKNDQCLTGTANNACGTGGVSCLDCTLNGGTCDTATSTCTGGGPCGPGNCSGCCAGNSCVAGTDTQACGANGEACVTCGLSYQVCPSGKCEIDPDSNWAVGVVSATILQTTTWDPLVPGGTAPDPYVGKSDTCSKWDVSPCTAAIDNTFNPVWNVTLGVFKASDLKSGWCVFIGDSDSVSECCMACAFNTIGMCQAQITDADLISASKTYNVCTNPDDSQNYLMGLTLQFAYLP